jgi:hypothetical protein
MIPLVTFETPLRGCAGCSCRFFGGAGGVGRAHRWRATAGADGDREGRARAQLPGHSSVGDARGSTPRRVAVITLRRARNVTYSRRGWHHAHREGSPAGVSPPAFGLSSLGLSPESIAVSTRPGQPNSGSGSV